MPSWESCAEGLPQRAVAEGFFVSKEKHPLRFQTKKLTLK
jgi:uncharacterized protein YjiK